MNAACKAFLKHGATDQPAAPLQTAKCALVIDKHSYRLILHAACLCLLSVASKPLDTMQLALFFFYFAYMLAESCTLNNTMLNAQLSRG